ncbi:LysE family translocator [Mesorhizobium sp. B2-4-12]|uniref:LysE family translocator n=1 Tax=Mesorhizobium sp. B2-4-12 TaxID=2589937 RepID=UPI00112B438C|nr:LysE family translocator [Mesorhizobium sp. B2-4-12]TPK94044.1 LysE family translocator [Mesorhizobium sp. B2-4-12]
MALTGFLAYSAALGVAAAIPGPGITALVARALGSGFRSSLAMSFGLMVGDLTYLTAVVLGLALVAQTFGMVFFAIKWAGIANLAFLGWRFWTAGITPETVEAKKGKAGSLSSFAAGLTVTLGNPKTTIFYLAITPTIVDLKTITPADYGILAALTFVVLFVVLVPYLALAAKARWFLKSPRALKALNRTAAGFVIGAAAAIAARQ